MEGQKWRFAHLGNLEKMLTSKLYSLIVQKHHGKSQKSHFVVC